METFRVQIMRLSLVSILAGFSKTLQNFYQIMINWNGVNIFSGIIKGTAGKHYLGAFIWIVTVQDFTHGLNT